MNLEQARKLNQTESRSKRTQRTLGTLIGWIVQSANSPINGEEAKQLLDMLEKDDDE